MATTFKEILEQLAESEDLNRDQSRFALGEIIEGNVSSEEAAAFLFGMRAKGETTGELTEFTKVMRKAAIPVNVPVEKAVDLCGTGGDASGTFNISTAAVFVVSGAGVPVLKHGNRSISSKCGSADVLEKLGAVASLHAPEVEKVFQDTGIAFMFAPNFHPAMKHIMPARRALRMRTFFNILGPLLNPAGVRRQVVGAYSREAAGKMIQILANLETERAYTLHAHDGLDEVSLTTTTELFELHSRLSTGSITFDPASLGYKKVSPESLQGGDASANASIIRAITKDESTEAQRDIVLLNAAFGIHVSGISDSLEEASEMAKESINSGAAAKALKTFVTATKDHHPEKS
ncbi:MAG: anthranilate phosphoribosyltransferase [Balneolaceae bacterium]